ncbi:hypothetical protein [Streptomyces violaceusniger]|uniref:Uncharacterized protein n=1 Tax=Streptomyces violaceusniger (strain Tu 4113) TaxID=653045 RepID=G2PGZ8_STRV4|nr:hypothetical protein [Streptomyces violaceusniger]AEM88572.1 hypothetical protein Strvi_9289 [Streptomyces violaceusniger Tu 4113]
MLDTDPAGDRFAEATLNGILSTKSLAAAVARHRALELPLE